MKNKLTIITLLFISSFLLATPATDTQKITPISKIENTIIIPKNETHSPRYPIIKEFIIGKITGTRRNAQFIENAKIYSRNSRDNVCWSAKINGTHAKKVAVIEEFTAPAKTISTSDENSNLTSANKSKYWKIETMMKIDSDHYIENCSVADNETLGTYTLTVIIDGQKQKPYKYNIVT